jgi:hypothetical protein
MSTTTRWTTGVVCWLGLASFSFGADGPSPGPGRALIVVGLPGDAAHEAVFRATVAAWRNWLTGPLGFAATEVRVLSGPDSGPNPVPGDTPATRESIAREAEAFTKSVSTEGRAWVFVLGHANLDGGHAFLHLPGPDLRDDQFAGLFGKLAAKEQVFWMTTAASGAFVPALAKAGRVVVAATEPSGETNETEFPHALAEVVAQPASRLDLDKDGKVSVFEVVLATTEAVEARFQADKRAPTEHARIDDNGDGVGTEPKAGPRPELGDGVLAAHTFLPTPKPTPPPARSAHGTERTPPPR